MVANDVLIDAFSRVRDIVHGTLDGLDENAVNTCPIKESNTIGWIIWHLTRVQDEHIGDMADVDPAWLGAGWYSKFALPFEPDETGYGQTPEEVAKTRVRPELLAGYYDAVHDQTIDYIKNLSEEDYNEIIDNSYTPPVSRSMRLVSVLADDLQHVGQAAYIKGLL